MAQSRSRPGRASQQVGQVLLQADVIDQREFDAPIDLGHEIDVALRPGLAARHRAEQAQVKR
jgi:hypothetical protein